MVAHQLLSLNFFQFLVDFWLFWAIFVLTENFKVTYFLGGIPIEIFLIPGMDKGIVE